MLVGTCRLKRYSRFFFLWKNFVSVYYFGFCAKKFQNLEKNFRQSFKNCIPRCLRNVFRIGVFFFRKNLWSLLNLGLWNEKDWEFRVIFPTKLSKLKTTCRVERFMRNIFLIISSFIFCFRRWSKKLEVLVNVPWQGCQTCILRVQMNVFNQNIFWEACLLINLWFWGKKLWLVEKIFSRLKTFTLRVQGNDFSEKKYLLTSLIFKAFSEPDRKKIHFWSQDFGKFGRVHSTHSDKHFLEISFYWLKSFIFQSILYIETKFVRNFSKNLYTEKISILIYTGRIER